MQTLADTWREEGATNTLQRMLRRKLLRQFAVVPDRIDQQIAQADQEQLDRWIDQMDQWMEDKESHELQELFPDSSAT